MFPRRLSENKFCSGEIKVVLTWQQHNLTNKMFRQQIGRDSCLFAKYTLNGLIESVVYILSQRLTTKCILY